MLLISLYIFFHFHVNLPYNWYSKTPAGYSKIYLSKLWGREGHSDHFQFSVMLQWKPLYVDHHVGCDVAPGRAPAQHL